MSFGEVLYQAYNAGILALAIVLLAISILIYPTLRKYNNLKHKK